MEWEAPAIVLDIRPYGEGDVVATVMTQAHGLHRGLVRGGGSRAQASLWLAGNMVQARWAARLADQLGGLTGELIHAGAAQVLDDPLALAMLSSCCAVAEDALPERMPHPGVFSGLLTLIPSLVLGERQLGALVRWEVLLLAELGFGLDFSACAVTGRRDGLVFVSPRTGRAVTAEAAGIWASRLLPLPGFLLDEAIAAGPADWRDGLRLTGHFLARDVFGHRHRPLPYARRRLEDRVADLADSQEKDDRTDDA
ncbi:DNA repair protein RecO [Rhodopila sp.]|jgi:DNA repair protein RecO (recombination protein O)|uniref:DNA repair protein RecO n=1 Tax=Rhodopila sp. TaxID=2480087 RepID=UPI002CE198C0|nr:DNA repair protein RecO [Rhodopila sp.]HVZ09436.1 DNA repair protein RecO [Rhodopila sp.]